MLDVQLNIRIYNGIIVNIFDRMINRTINNNLKIVIYKILEMIIFIHFRLSR